jgi:hypothetical protein
MQSCPRGIGKHIQYIILGFIAMVVCLKGFVGRPKVLPLFFNLQKIVIHQGWFFECVKIRLLRKGKKVSGSQASF